MYHILGTANKSDIVISDIANILDVTNKSDKANVLL